MLKRTMDVYKGTISRLKEVREDMKTKKIKKDTVPKRVGLD